MVPAQLDMQLLMAVVEELGLTELYKEIPYKDIPPRYDWIKLDVRGTIFKTMRVTLTKYPESFLAEQVNSTKHKDGLRLDIDPEYFRPCLNWLR